MPVKVITNGKQLGAFQLELKYDTALLEFKKIELTEKMMNWTSFTNPSNGVVAFGSADLKGGQWLLNDGEQVMILQFIAKKPQDEWGTAAVWTGPKFVGGSKCSRYEYYSCYGYCRSSSELNKILLLMV